MVEYPDIKDIINKTKTMFYNDYDYLKNSKEIHVEFDAIAFPQVWGSTCGGFDRTVDGEPVMSGQAWTKEYTVVVHEISTNTFYIFFGGKPCYKVTNAKKDFYKDLRDRKMASLSEAKTKY